MTFPQIKAIALIAEGVPERHAREILWMAQAKGVLIIGPATVGGIKPGCFRIGNSGGYVSLITHETFPDIYAIKYDGQHHFLEALPAWFRWLRIEVRRHVQRAQQYLVTRHRRYIRGYRHWW